MGAGVSSMVGPEGDGGGHQTGLGDIPESCVAEVMLRLDPPEICALARLGRVFRGAATADFVWEAKLPDNYRYMMKVASEERKDGSWDKMSKKEIFAKLCRPNPFDGGAKEFWLEKWKGQVCMSISSKGLAITGIDDRRYWNHIPSDESRFHSVAYLQQIWWFEVDGNIEFQFPPGTYSLYFRLYLGRPTKRLGLRSCSPEHIHGWDIKPVRFHVSTSDGQQAVSKQFLRGAGTWIHYHAGDFTVQDSSSITKVKFSMTQIDCTHTKGGLCVDCVYIYPKGFRKQLFPVHT
ncbi:F-box protein PP2-A13-like [Dioscorea cayenensis subsp. rotundata]|uniref:F-box protein PP2-A13-like n=1 Tax=Dioscorea cayennensis subsp. rotundata TaxID=55577 RepID=A0AB40B6I3_DIOCR|nr:F-box protein PP2-A13-like [Dioscorea cayenensis subsp. rotundata]